MTCLYYNSNLNNYVNDRFRRPSQSEPLQNPYSFQDFVKECDAPPFMTCVFQNSCDVIQAYFAILQHASNMPGYYGGCGSIGDSLLPYPYAYELLSNDLQSKMPLEEYIHSFRGIGHITLLNLHEAYHPNPTDSSTCYYMFETEMITGPFHEDDTNMIRMGSYFVYQYGIMETKYDQATGWKITKLSSLPQDFLCAPGHGWIYSAVNIVTFVYKEWYGLIRQIDCVNREDNMIHIHASSHQKSYRFDFVRLSNGYDVLLHENICSNEEYKSINLLKPEDQRIKLSILNPDLNWK